MMRAILVVLAVAGTAAARPQASGRGFDPDAVYKVPRGTAPSEGPADAPVTIVVWSDHACTYCNRVQVALDQVRRLFPGQIRFVHRALPLDDENTVTAEAVLAAAAQGRFRPMSDRLYGIHGQVDRAGVEIIASELGLDMVRFRADLDSHAYRKQIDADVADARALGIDGTPMFFVNGRPIAGSQSVRVFTEVVEQELKRAGRRDYDALVAEGKPSADSPGATRPAFELDSAAVYRMGLGLPGHQKGPDDAAVTIVEWSDFQCPFCAHQAPVLAHVLAKYGKDVRIVYRHLAMAFHRNASLAAEASIAAAQQGKFWEFHDQVFSHFGALTRPDLDKFAEAIGLDMAAFRAALDERRYRDLVVAEGAAASALGVDGTPTMFINGSPISGAKDADKLDALIDAQLERARTTIATGLAARDYYAVVMSGAIGDDRADPSTVPTVRNLELRDDDRLRAVAAACRRRDGTRATKLAATLSADARRRAALVCTGLGIDLP